MRAFKRTGNKLLEGLHQRRSRSNRSSYKFSNVVRPLISTLAMSPSEMRTSLSGLCLTGSLSGLIGDFDSVDDDGR